jgi:hypothetical protein
MLVSVLILAAAVTCQPQTGVCEKPVSADSIVDSIGVNIHLHFGNTVYGDFPLIEHLLQDLHVRHTRDGLVDTRWKPYYERHVALGKLGIKCTFITNPAESDAVLANWPSRVPGAFEAYEAPNEYDNSGDPNWAATLNAFVPRLFKAVKTNEATAEFPVIGPSLIRPADYAGLAGLSPYFDYSNMHNYFAGRNPGTYGWGNNGYGSIDYNMFLAQTVWPGKPILTTETGYFTKASVQDGLPESIEGEYAPRLVLEQTLHEVKRTYIYELIDENKTAKGTEGFFGLAHADGSPKPAYTALKNLIALLADPGQPAPLENLQFTLHGATANVHHLLMQKRDSTYYLAFWIEDQNYDVNAMKETPSKPQQVTFESDQTFADAELLAFAAEGTVITKKLSPSARLTLVASGNVSILFLK